MSDNVEGQAQENEGSSMATPEMIENLQEQLNQLKSTNDRLLDQSKDWKAKYQGIKEEVTSEKKAVLEKDGKLEELLELERNKAHEYQREVEKMKRETMKSSLKFEVARHAADAHDVRDVLASLDIDSIDYNEDTGNFAGVAEAVDNVRKNKAYIFDTYKPVGTPNERPAANVPVEKTLDEKIRENPMAALKGALADFV